MDGCHMPLPLSSGVPFLHVIHKILRWIFPPLFTRVFFLFSFFFGFFVLFVCFNPEIHTHDEVKKRHLTPYRTVVSDMPHTALGGWNGSGKGFIRYNNGPRDAHVGSYETL